MRKGDELVEQAVRGMSETGQHGDQEPGQGISAAIATRRKIGIVLREGVGHFFHWVSPAQDGVDDRLFAADQFSKDRAVDAVR